MADALQNAQTRPVRVSSGSMAKIVLALIFTGTVGGATVSLAILGAKAVVDALSNPSSTGFTQLLTSIVSRMFGVLTMWVEAPRDGAIMGAAAGLAVSLAYLVALWLRRAGLARWILLALLILAGAIGAAAGSQDVLAGFRVWTAAAGALFGLAAGFAIFPRRPAPG